MFRIILFKKHNYTFSKKVPQSVPKRVPSQNCQQVPRQSCSTDYKSVPKQECKQVPRQKCQSVPKQDCRQVPRQVPRKVPKQNCRQVPEQFCESVPKQVPTQKCTKVCVDRRWPPPVCLKTLRKNSKLNPFFIADPIQRWMSNHSKTSSKPKMYPSAKTAMFNCACKSS